MSESESLFSALREPTHRTRWLSFRYWLGKWIKANGERLSWWVNP